MSRYLVTGGAGFIGSNITRHLVEAGETVAVIDNLSTGKKENLADIMSEIKFVEGDICDPEVVSGLMKGTDFVLHQAALPSVPRSVADPVSSNNTNINGTLNLLVAARDMGVKRFVFASSSSVYGDSATLPKHEGMMPNPLSPYAVSKLTSEYYGKVFHKVYGLETVGLRYFNVFGPYQDPESQYSAVIPKFITAMLNNQAPVTHGDGEQSRDFTYITNNIKANLAACHNNNVAGKVFNISCGSRISLNDMIKKINALLGTSLEPTRDEPRIGDVKHSQGSIEYAKSDLKFVTDVSFQEGLKETIEWYKKTLGLK